MPKNSCDLSQHALPLCTVSGESLCQKHEEAQDSVSLIGLRRNHRTHAGHPQVCDRADRGRTCLKEVYPLKGCEDLLEIDVMMHRHPKGDCLPLGCRAFSFCLILCFLLAQYSVYVTCADHFSLINSLLVSHLRYRRIFDNDYFPSICCFLSKLYYNINII